MKIYCIEDKDGLKYIGKTKKKYLCNRMSEHRADKKRNQCCSSKKLDLEHSRIYLIEECEDSNSTEREKYWINNTECVNECKLNLWLNNEKKYHQDYYQKNKEKKYHQLKELRAYQISWGGQLRSDNLCMLRIDPNLFKI